MRMQTSCVPTTDIIVSPGFFSVYECRKKKKKQKSIKQLTENSYILLCIIIIVISIMV